MQQTCAFAFMKLRWDPAARESGNLLVCDRSADFFVAVAMGTELVQLPAGSVLLSAAPLADDGWLQPNNAVWVLRD